jgi:hypothetical protein
MFSRERTESNSGKFNVLYSFIPCTQPPCTEGQVPNHLYASHLARDSKGNLYGIEEANDCALGWRMHFQNRHEREDHRPLRLYTSGSPVFYDAMGLVLGSDGDFYGSTPIEGFEQPECDDNGFQGCGSVFHLTPSAESAGGIAAR